MTSAQNAGDTSDDVVTGDDTTNDDQGVSGAAGTSNDASDDTSSGDTVSRSELDKALERMKAADKRASELDSKLKEIERKEKTELENAQSDLEELKSKLGDREQQVADLQLENAFLTQNKYVWHDPTDAMRLMDTTGVRVEDGKVIGLAEAVEKLAKAKPHLLKSTDGDDEGKGKNSTEASGTPRNGTRKGDKKEPPRDYSARFPALKR